MSSIKRARIIKATGATAVLEAAFLPEGSLALCHPRRIQDRSNDARLQAGDAAKATGAITAPAAAFAMLHRIYAKAQDQEDFWPPFGPENDQAIQDFLVQLEKTLDAAKRIRTS